MTDGQKAFERWASATSSHGPVVTIPAPEWEQLPEATRAKWEQPEFRCLHLRGFLQCTE